MSQKVLYLLLLNFPLLIVTTSPGVGETGLLQTVVATDVCYVACRDTVSGVAAGDDVVATVGGAL